MPRKIIMVLCFKRVFVKWTSCRKKKRTILLLFFVFFLSFSAAKAETESSCIACHKTVEGVSYVEHNFADWDKSVHAKAGINCNVCHNGDPSKNDKDSAHKGILRSTDQKSPVYFTQIPETCGSCHQEEFKAFKKSVHFKELQHSGRGPNCVTCHGSMANYVMAPRELEMTCTLCHRRPTQAYATLMSLNNASSSLARLKEELQGDKSSQHQIKVYKEALDLYNSAVVDWHTFKMKSVLQNAQEVTRRTNGAINELKLKRMQK